MTLHRGKLATEPEILEVRPLARADLGILTVKRRPDGDKQGTSAVTRFRDSHHRIARLFASGLRLAQVVERSGYSYNRVYTLSSDPAFQDLIAKYREKVDESWVETVDEFYKEGTEIMRIVQRQVRDRLNEADDEEGTPIPMNQLIALGADHMDRFGYGKRQTNVNINADFAVQLEKARGRMGGKTIEATVLPASPQSAPELLGPPRVEVKTPVQKPSPRILRRA